jgi:cytochrome c-type biogenesis protein
MDTGNVGLSLAFLGGLASFLSPCVFALVPAYIGYLSGRTAGSTEANRWTTFSHGLAFVLGFSVVFILLGLGASAIGSLLFDLRPYLTKIGGVVVVIFGLHMTGLIRLRFLDYDLRAQQTPNHKWGYLSSFMLGVFFSAGWAPCVGPILGTILTLSLYTGSITQGFWLLTAYSAGLAIPFMIAAVQIGLITTVLRQYGKTVRYVEIVMGGLMIIVGVLLFTGRFGQLASLGSFFNAYDEARLGVYLLVGFILAVVFGLIPAYLAHQKGRNFYDWWLFGIVLIFVAIPAALLIKPKSTVSETAPAIGDKSAGKSWVEPN